MEKEGFEQLIDRLVKEKKEVCVNGIGADWFEAKDGERHGGSVILARHEDYITVELTTLEDKNKGTKEIIYIPIIQVNHISERPTKIGGLVDGGGDIKGYG